MRSCPGRRSTFARKFRVRKKVGIFIFDGVEALDVVGPYEVFSVADELNAFSLYECSLFAEHDKAVKTVNGLRLLPDVHFANLPQFDILLIPGGVGIRKVIEDPAVMNALSAAAQHAQYVLSVCTGAFALAKLGWLDQQPFCTHHTTYEEVLALAPTAIPCRDERFVGDGRQFTSAGVTAGIELTLHLVGLMHGEETSRQVGSYIEYNTP